jgi:hypothetical protein
MSRKQHHISGRDHLISSHLISSHLISSHLISSHLISSLQQQENSRDVPDLISRDVQQKRCAVLKNKFKKIKKKNNFFHLFLYSAAIHNCTLLPYTNYNFIFVLYLISATEIISSLPQRSSHLCHRDHLISVAMPLQKKQRH